MASESASRGNIGSKMMEGAVASANWASIRHLNQQNIAKCKENEGKYEAEGGNLQPFRRHFVALQSS